MFLPSNITLKFGDSGDFVAELQRRLAMVKCFSDDQVNGFYDGATVNGVMQFQGMSGLHADGVAGPETLRRLNGVIAGDTGGSTADDKKEEEQRAAAARTETLFNLPDGQVQQNAWGNVSPQAEAAPAVEPAPAPAQPAMQPMGLDPAMFAAAAAPMAPQQPSPLEMSMRAQEQMLSQNPARDLNTMTDNIMAQERLNAQQQMQQQAAQQQTQRPPEVPLAPPAPAPMAPQPLPQAEQQPVTAAPVAEPQGLMQRAGRFANAMMQKLSDYFEAKLPPSVMADVRAAGQVMAQSGVREAPIPTGPEMGGPAQQLPTRGPEQQPTQTR